MNEEWRHCEGFPGYKISDAGRVLSVAKSKRALLHPTPQRNRNGKIIRMQVLLKNAAGKKVMVRVHTLVLAAFVGPRPNGLQCCHRDGDASNNRLENLRWDTAASNRLDSCLHGTEPRGDSHHKSTIGTADAERIKDLLRFNLSVCAIAKWIGCSRGAARGIAEGRTWKQV
jgi:hypothetical protein